MLKNMQKLVLYSPRWKLQTTFKIVLGSHSHLSSLFRRESKRVAGEAARDQPGHAEREHPDAGHDRHRRLQQQGQAPLRPGTYTDKKRKSIFLIYK